MLNFKTFIYGNVPVYVEIEKDGDIASIGVLHKDKVLYWLDLNPEEIDKFKVEFFKEIEDTLDGSNPQDTKDYENHIKAMKSRERYV